MTFENHTRGEFHEQNRSAKDAEALKKEEKKAALEASAADSHVDQAKKTGHPEETVGYVGGQPIDDARGLDISQYTGPNSKPSSEFEDPNAPYHQGPGSGLTPEEERDGAAKPDPESD